MFKNVASQKIQLFAFDTTTGAAKTGDAANITAYVSKDHGTVTVLADTLATEMDATNAPGVYVFDVAQGETNANELTFSAKSSTSGVAIVPRLISTDPPNYTAMGIASGGGVALTSTLKVGVALADFGVTITDNVNHLPVTTSPTVTVTRSIDGAAFGATTAGTATELSAGTGDYVIDLSSGDMGGKSVRLKFTASGCDTLTIQLFLEP